MGTKSKRLTTADRVNQLLSKDEPTFEGLESVAEIAKLDLTLALNWYSQNKDREASHKYLAAYCKQRGIKVSSRQIESQVPTLGFICRMVTLGAVLDAPSLAWIAKKIEAMTSHSDNTPQDISAPTAIVAKAPTITIQDRIKDRASKCIGELEGVIDSFILSNFKVMPNALEIMRKHEIKGVHGPIIVNFFKKWRDEYRIALTEKDEAINEAYSNYSLVQMKKMEAAYDGIMSDALKVMGESQASKSPRAKKPKSPEKQIKNLKYCAGNDDLGIKSVSPLRIIGAEQVFVYNMKNRMLTQYVADDANGLGVKGSTFINYSNTKTRTKKLRKPDEVLPQIVSGGKVYLKNIMENLTTKDGKVTGRAGSDVLLLRVIV
jgi:hypothetical protein